jgi:repressor LexA
MRTKDENRCREIADFIEGYRQSHGTSPTLQEIADGVGIAKSSASRYAAYMRGRGELSVSGRRSVMTQTEKRALSESVRVPVLGRVACGVPNIADGNIDGYVRLPASLFGRGAFYILTAGGDSMVDAGICDGDLVVVRMQDTAEPGQIVVALTEEGATLKRYYPEPSAKRIRLQPENRSMEPIYVDGCTVQGVAVNVIKKL